MATFSAIYKLTRLKKSNVLSLNTLLGCIMYDLPYTKRLKMLNLNSLHRRRERYCIIYLWKILEGLVPNLGYRL